MEADTYAAGSVQAFREVRISLRGATRSHPVTPFTPFSPLSPLDQLAVRVASATPVTFLAVARSAIGAESAGPSPGAEVAARLILEVLGLFVEERIGGLGVLGRDARLQVVVVREVVRGLEALERRRRCGSRAALWSATPPAPVVRIGDRTGVGGRAARARVRAEAAHVGRARPGSKQAWLAMPSSRRSTWGRRWRRVRRVPGSWTYRDAVLTC